MSAARRVGGDVQDQASQESRVVSAADNHHMLLKKLSKCRGSDHVPGCFV